MAVRPPRQRKRPQPASPVWGPDVPEAVPRGASQRYAVTRRVDRAPRGKPPRHVYGWIVVPANYRVIEFNGSRLLLNARDQVESSIDGDLVEVHGDIQDARVACNRYNNVQEILES